jgi:hypothetical protein
MGSAHNLTVAALVLALVLWRQLRPREVREDNANRLLLVLGVVGMVELVEFADDHRVTALAWTLVGASLLVGAILGLMRGASVRIWRRDGGAGATGHPGHRRVVGGRNRDPPARRPGHLRRGLGRSRDRLDRAPALLRIALAAQRLVTLNRAAQLSG